MLIFPILSGFKISHYKDPETYSIPQRCSEDSTTMFTTPLGEQPPTVGVGVGSQELMDLLLDSATDNNSLSWQEDVAVAVEMGRPSMTGGNTPTRSYMADSNLTTTTSNELNTPDLEMARPSWPTDVAIPSTSSSNQPATTSPLTLNCSGNVFIPMGSVAAEELCYSADSPSTFEMVNPFAVTDSSDAMFDALLNANGFGIDTTDTALNTIDDTDINNLDVNALLDMFDNDVKVIYLFFCRENLIRLMKYNTDLSHNMCLHCRGLSPLFYNLN